MAKVLDEKKKLLAYEQAKQGNWDAVGETINELAGFYKDGVDSTGNQGWSGKGENWGAAKQFMTNLQKEFGYNANDYYTGVVNKNKGTAGSGIGSGSSSRLSTGTTGGYGSFNDFLDSMGYDSYEEQTRKYIQDAVNNAVKGYESQIADVNADTKELARQAYVNKMMGEKNLDQKLAASGMAGGMADSQRIGLQANYENNLVALEQQRADTVRELERAIENARLTGDMQTAQELASYLQQVQGQWNSYVQNQMALENQNYWNQQQMENQNYWNQKNMETDAAATARNWALTLLESGSMPDDATLTAAGISRTEADSLLKQVLAAQRRSNYVAPTPEPTVEDNLIAAISALSQNSNLPMSENEVKSLWNSGYDFSGYATAIPALGQYYAAQGITQTTEPSDVGGMQNKYYKTYENSILQTAQSGYADNAAGMVDAIWNQLNAEQRQTLQQKLAALGLEYQP